MSTNPCPCAEERPCDCEGFQEKDALIRLPLRQDRRAREGPEGVSGDQREVRQTLAREEVLEVALEIRDGFSTSRISSVRVTTSSLENRCIESAGLIPSAGTLTGRLSR